MPDNNRNFGHDTVQAIHNKQVRHFASLKKKCPNLEKELDELKKKYQLLHEQGNHTDPTLSRQKFELQEQINKIEREITELSQQ